MKTTKSNWKLYRVFALACLLVLCTAAWADDILLSANFKINNGHDLDDSTATSKYHEPATPGSKVRTITDSFANYARDNNGNRVATRFTWSAPGVSDYVEIAPAGLPNAAGFVRQIWNYIGNPPTSSTQGSFQVSSPVIVSRTAQRWFPPTQLAVASNQGGNGIGLEVDDDGGIKVAISVDLLWVDYDPDLAENI
jgi:hypothetical protein